MDSTSKIQEILGIILLSGIFISASLVIIGGLVYLLHHGGENMQMELLQSVTYQTSVKEILLGTLSFTPLRIIELGLLLLVATQVLRVALLTWFYALIRDYWFVSFSIFILFILVYSLFWRN
ncbi:DUF1634 domain-containing protein [Aquicella lusitana]|uniref:Putative membrane protein n=1 Tax=Aquicella lusitana TaxID=254246 RepID=A0A370G0E8_9COXI|nr:DUF1634 domain-containing protein [Aquicella lusitana]RDI37205.1 putative membrane protein [Aquicella lusitana]VVC74279.1 hypothetical protein AQULUS_20440 [Aquicella lusitana]